MTTQNARLCAGFAMVLIAAVMNGADTGAAAMHAALFGLGFALIAASFAEDAHE